ncbi:MAG: nucleotidyltransferase family protein [Bacteroidetes bacterium]|nr:nucleotidyltransferase family protein [Bacteroidota bacterium]
MKAMIFAAGLGSRLKPFTDNHPKALAEVNGRTLLELSIRYLQRFGIEDVIVNVHHFADQIEQVLNDNNGFGSWVAISDERREVLETGGGLKKATDFFQGESDFVVLNVDVLTNLDLAKLIAFHRAERAIGSLAVMKRESSRQLLFDEDMTLCGWQNVQTGQLRMSKIKPSLSSFAFSGIQVLSPEILEMPFDGKFSMIDVYLHFAETAVVKGFDHSGNIFIDVGKPDSLAQAAYFFDKL